MKIVAFILAALVFASCAPRDPDAAFWGAASTTFVEISR